MTLSIILGLAAIIICAHIVETVTGFGATVIGLSLAALFMPIGPLVVTLVIIGLTQSIWIVARGYRDIRWDVLLKTVLPFCAPGLAIGAWLASSLESSDLKKVLGVFVVVLASIELVRLIRNASSAKPLPRPVAAAVVFGGGLIHGMFASGGPLMVYYFSRTIHDKQEFRVTLSVLWMLLNAALLVSYAITGRLESGPALTALYLMPALAVGIVVGELLHGRMKERVFRTFVQGVLLFTGIALLL